MGLLCRLLLRSVHFCGDPTLTHNSGIPGSKACKGVFLLSLTAQNFQGRAHQSEDDVKWGPRARTQKTSFMTGLVGICFY
jgi:hypothetical protein